MCGITGFLDLARDQNVDALNNLAARMADKLAHRGPGDAGTWADADAGLALGFRRLAIIDLSDAGHQPMHSADGRYVIVFNGEIYNFQTLRAELVGRNHAFRGHSDTEVILAAVCEWGIEAAVERFNGMFAFALWDRQARQLHLVRDRLGIKPLYYGWTGRVFVFGSELKPLRAHPDFDRPIDRDALALYLQHAYIPAPYSIYKGIRKLPPGHRLCLSEERAASGRLPEPFCYWHLQQIAEYDDPFTGSDQDAVDALDSLLRDAVKRRMVADVPLGAFLSGGIDSSTMVALMQTQSSRPVRTFTIGVPSAHYDEAQYARKVAAHLGTDHTELYVTPEQAQAVIPRLPALYDEPFADASQIPTFLVSELTRRHVTVSLSGDGGDELFGGYNRYTWVPSIWQKVGWLPRPVRRTAGSLLQFLPDWAWNRLLGWTGRQRAGDLAHKLGRLLQVANSREELYLATTRIWQQDNVVLGADPPTILLTDRQQWGELPSFAEQMMYLDTLTYLPDDILVKVDRASMGVSLEARVPLLDHRVVGFAWRIPLSMRIRDGVGKWLLRQVLYRYVPAALVERPKAGFAVPLEAWLRGPLRDWAEALLNTDRLLRQGFFDPAPIQARLQAHLDGRHNEQYTLWTVLMFQAWLEERV